MTMSVPEGSQVILNVVDGLFRVYPVEVAEFLEMMDHQFVNPKYELIHLVLRRMRVYMEDPIVKEVMTRLAIGDTPEGGM